MVREVVCEVEVEVGVPRVVVREVEVDAEVVVGVPTLVVCEVEVLVGMPVMVTVGKPLKV